MVPTDSQVGRGSFLSVTADSFQKALIFCGESVGASLMSDGSDATSQAVGRSGEVPSAISGGASRGYDGDCGRGDISIWLRRARISNDGLKGTEAPSMKLGSGGSSGRAKDGMR